MSENTPAAIQAVAPIPWQDIVKAIRAVDDEAAERGRMYPQDSDEHADKRDAERYRKLRDNGVPSTDGHEDDALLIYKGFGESSLLPDEIDAAVDALPSPTKEST